MIKKADIIKQVKAILSDKDTKLARDDARINRAFTLAIGDLGDRLSESERLDTQTVTVAVGDREIEIEGVSCDIDEIFYILYGTGSDQTALDYVDLSIFLKDYNDPSAAQGTPTKFTFIGLSDNGYPNIKLDCPAGGNTSMEVWYFAEPSEDAQGYSKAAALLNLTIGHFFGTGSADGLKYYTMGLNAIKAARTKTKKVAAQECGFVTNRFDTETNRIRINRRNAR